MKTILKEIDPLAFDEALKMNSLQKKQYAVKQDEEDRRALDKKWDALNDRLKKANPSYIEPPLPFRTNNLIRDFNGLYAKIYDKERYI